MSRHYWAAEAVTKLLAEIAVSLTARRERERVEAEAWLTKLRRQAKERREKDRKLLP